MNKSYRVGIQATDGYSKPFAKASQANVEFEKSVSAARAEVNKLGKTQRDVANYQSTKTNLSNSNKEIENLRNSLRLRERLLTSHKTQLQKHQSDVSREKAKLRRLEKRGASDAEINKQKVNLTEITNKLAGLRKERDKSTVSIKSEKKKLERLTAAQEKHTNRLKALEGEIERAGFSTKKLGNAEETLARKTAKATRKMELQKKQLKELRKLEDRLANAQDKRGKAMAQAAKGAGILYGMSGTLDKSGDFQDAMVDFAKKQNLKQLLE